MNETVKIIIFIVLGIAALVFLRVFGVIIDGILAGLFYSMSGGTGRGYKRF